MPRYQLTLRLTFRGPLLSHATAIGPFGVDVPMLRDHHGRWCIPATEVKGRLRQAMEDLRQAAPASYQAGVKELMGPPLDKAKDGFARDLGRLHFSEDFVHAKPFQSDDHGENRHRPHPTLSRIAMDGKRGAVERGAYIVTEAPFPAGVDATFSGSIRYGAADQPEADKICAQVEQALRFTTQMGANRSIGFGRLLAVEVKQSEISADTAPVSITSPSPALDLAITPNAPFCIARRPVDANLYESEEIIPGGAIKGALAAAWNEMLGRRATEAITERTDEARRELGQHFHAVRFTHAFPVPTGNGAKRPTAVPLSVVKVKRGEEDQWFDIAQCEEPVLIHDQAPAFAVDWKNGSDVEAAFGWAQPRRELRVRTAIDSDKRRARDEHLFAYERIIPDGFVWAARVFLEGVPKEDRAAVEGQLRGLLAGGLECLGKTKVAASVAVHKTGHWGPLPTCPDRIDGKWFVTLQTPAILCDPEPLDEGCGEAELHEAYAAAWHDLSGGALSLDRFLAKQALAGGRYLAGRFGAGGGYYPYLLTELGSLFVLAPAPGCEEEARTCLTHWLTHGLPLPSWAETRYARNGKPGDRWENCPYLRDNGYGEIAVNLACHIDKAPPKKMTQAVALTTEAHDA